MADIEKVEATQEIEYARSKFAIHRPMTDSQPRDDRETKSRGKKINLHVRAALAHITEYATRQAPDKHQTNT